MRHALRLSTLAVSLLLSACHRYPPPVIVDFPNDPRVMHGSWELTVTGRYATIEDFYLDGAGQNLVVYEHDAESRAFRADGSGDYVEVDATAFVGLSSRHFDPVLDAVVALRRSGARVEVRVVPLAGSSATTTELSVPAGFTVEKLFAASGRTFMVLRDASGAPQLRWWDSLTGAYGGALTPPQVGDYITVSPNGRAVAFWDLGGWSGRVRVFDTAALGPLETVALGTCRGAGVTEISADGRWFVFAGCTSNLHVVDLADVAAGASYLGVKAESSLTFATDSSELVWVDRHGAVRSLDVQSRVQQVIHQLSETERYRLNVDWGAWFEPRLVLDRSASVLALTKGDGRVTLLGLAPGASAVAVPPLELESASLELEATFDHGSLASDYAYEFAGTLDLGGVSHRVEGHAHAYGLHHYVPVAGALSPEAIAPPHLSAQAYVWAPADDEPSLYLSFGTRDRFATTYLGELLDADGAGGYLVELQRTAP